MTKKHKRVTKKKAPKLKNWTKASAVRIRDGKLEIRK